MKKANGSYMVLFSTALATMIISISPATQALPASYEVLKADCMHDYVVDQLNTSGTIIDKLTNTENLSESNANRALQSEVLRSVNTAMDTVFSACAKVRLAEIQQQQK